MNKPVWIIVNSSLDQGGASVASKRLAYSLSKRNYRVIFIFTNPKPPDIDSYRSSIEFIHFPQNSLKRRFGSLLSRVFSKTSLEILF